MDAQTDCGWHISKFVEIVGEKYVLTEETSDSSYLKDWSGDYVSSALCVLLPTNTQEVSEIVSYCWQAGLNLIPQGGNTGLVGGCHATDPHTSVLLNTRRMNRIQKLDVENYTIEVQAGCIIQDIQDAAADQNRLFPVSFGAQGSAQIGGAIATNAGGLNVLRYGMVRDLLLGIEVVLPDGSVLDCRSKLRKDNRGLDLKHLFVGTEGTLGVVTSATFKLFPLPRHKETAFLALQSVEDVVTFYNFAREHCADLLSAFELIPRRCVELALEHQSTLRDPLSDPYEVYVLLELAASGPLDLRTLVESLLETALEKELVLDGAMAESLTQSEAMLAIREAMVEAQAALGRHLRTDISVPVSALPAFIQEAHAKVAEIATDWEAIAYGHVGDGNVHFNVLAPTDLPDEQIRETIPVIVSEIYDVLDQFEGSISAEHGIGRTRRKAFQDRQNETAQTLSESLKALIDSHGTMNPGCLFDDTRRATK